MFGLFSKQRNTDMPVYSLASGELISIEQANDPAFSQKAIGDGYAIIPENGDIYSPIDGEVTSIFPTKHALGLKSDAGIEVLVHMGVDTVELNGAPFKVLVSVGDKVTHSDKIITVDLDYLKEHGKNNDMMVVFPESGVDTKFNLYKHGKVSASDMIADLILEG